MVLGDRYPRNNLPLAGSRTSLSLRDPLGMFLGARSGNLLALLGRQLVRNTQPEATLSAPWIEASSC